MSDHKRKADALNEINAVLQDLDSEDLVEEVVQDFVQIWRTDLLDSSILVQNLHDALVKINKHEHQSGLFRTLVASVCGSNITTTAMAKLLGIHRKSAASAKKRRLEWNTSTPYIALHKKPEIHRIRIPSEVFQSIMDWMNHAFTPSSNTSNVVRQKDFLGVVEYKVKHWRTETLQNCYAQYLASNPEHESKFGKTYFISLIP